MSRRLESLRNLAERPGTEGVREVSHPTNRLTSSVGRFKVFVADAVPSWLATTADSLRIAGARLGPPFGLPTDPA